MKEWLFGVISCSILLTILLQLVPEGNVKKAVSVGFGFVFLIVIVSPLTDLINSFVNDLANNKIQANLAYSDLLGNVKDIKEYDEYTEGVLNEYINRLQNEVDKAVGMTGVHCVSVVSINRDINSDGFGRVLSVQCNISKVIENVKKDKKGIVKPIDRIEKIVIGSGGIDAVKPGEEDEDVTKEMKEKESDIKKTVSFLLDVDESDVLIDWR